ncbi:hypothetical protein [Zoogloea sp.]|uniref:hypothetical protein n=1 Tax=Zoogloea sp. TaxID=49181 RepID=UPI0035B3F142
MRLSSAEAWDYPISPTYIRVASLSFWGNGYSRQRIEPGLRLGNRLQVRPSNTGSVFPDAAIQALEASERKLKNTS